jgi:hypothetical protein
MVPTDLRTTIVSTLSTHIESHSSVPSPTNGTVLNEARQSWENLAFKCVSDCAALFVCLRVGVGVTRWNVALSTIDPNQNQKKSRCSAAFNTIEQAHTHAQHCGAVRNM